MLNVQDLSQIHCEMNLVVPDPIILSNSHDGIDAPTLKKRKLEDGDDNCAGDSLLFLLFIGHMLNEETVAELRTVESEAASYLDQISRYYITRAKLVSKIAKYPHVEDYRRTVTEIDEKEYISLRLIISELRNQYVTLHDMILKNIEKIKRPRNSNAETLY
ncbi:hypothetical protein GDO78_004516 [Eleutherodactylus coqui]|uniref:Proteasome activator PA28 C-terminal domain-containing protein n=1 Tax=Eleutherodactylus coqui TaxID=57060 RepID=A0A8J6K3S0_ELECQ|nr:hypothetical protein GDO78_004516 [Eleutherodactylus coqui]